MFYSNLSGKKSHMVNIHSKSGSHIWLLLPNEIKPCTEIDKFKSLLKS